MLSLLALCRYRDTREEFIHVLFGGVRPEPEPSCRISIAPIILFSTGDVLSGVVASFGICHYVLAAPPLVSPWSAVWQRSGEGGERVYKPLDVDFQHPSDTVRLFLSLHSHQSHPAQLTFFRALSSPFIRHNGCIQARHSPCGRHRRRCLPRWPPHPHWHLQLRHPPVLQQHPGSRIFIHILVVFVHLLWFIRIACWLRQLLRHGWASLNQPPGNRPSYRCHLVRFRTHLTVAL